jgi:hypothetical protein
VQVNNVSIKCLPVNTEIVVVVLVLKMINVVDEDSLVLMISVLYSFNYLVLIRMVCFILTQSALLFFPVLIYFHE